MEAASSPSSGSDLDSVEDLLEVMSERGSETPPPDDAALEPEEREEQQETFYNQTVGAVFVWTLENLVMGAVHYCVYLLAEALAAPGEGGVVIAKWCSSNVLYSTLVMAATNALIAFVERTPGIFSRHYMMVTQAYCGTISFLGLVFSAVAWKASLTEHWRVIFTQSSSPLLSTGKLLIVIGNNVQWVLSLLLTYSCTPFGQSNSAFVHIPVAAAAALFLVLVNETATNELVLCQGYAANLFTYAFTNAAIFSSLMLYVWSAVEWDPANVFPSFMHSTAVTRQRFDVYALIHGGLLFVIVTCYGAIARLSQSTFFGTMFILAFTIACTVVHAFDLRYLATTILASDDQDERRARALRDEMAWEHREQLRRSLRRGEPRWDPPLKGHSPEGTHGPAEDDHAYVHRRRREHEASHTPKAGYTGKERQIPRRSHERHQTHHRVRRHSEDPPKEYEHGKAGHEHGRAGHEHGKAHHTSMDFPPDFDRDELRRRGDFFRRSNTREPLPTGLTLFPNIPVSLRRTVH